MQRMLDIETALGRERTVKWGPRIIDLDLLSYDQVIMDSPGIDPSPSFFGKEKVCFGTPGGDCPGLYPPGFKKNRGPIKG